MQTHNHEFNLSGFVLVHNKLVTRKCGAEVCAARWQRLCAGKVVLTPTPFLWSGDGRA
jgi:hypothetical protein